MVSPIPSRLLTSPVVGCRGRALIAKNHEAWLQSTGQEWNPLMPMTRDAVEAAIIQLFKDNDLDLADILLTLENLTEDYSEQAANAEEDE